MSKPDVTLEAAIAALREVRAGAEELERILAAAKGDETTILAGGVPRALGVLTQIKRATQSASEGMASFFAWWEPFARRAVDRSRG